MLDFQMDSISIDNTGIQNFIALSNCKLHSRIVWIIWLAYKDNATVFNINLKALKIEGIIIYPREKSIKTLLGQGGGDFSFTRTKPSLQKSLSISGLIVCVVQTEELFDIVSKVKKHH